MIFVDRGFIIFCGDDKVNRNVLKKILSLMLCFCFIVLSGCGSNDSESSKVSGSPTSSEKSASDVTDDTTAETNKTTVTTTTTTSKTTEKESTENSKTEPSSKPVDSLNGVKYVALTFDDGPYGEVTNRILDTLEKNGAKATFFVVGNRADSYKSTLKRASDMGCEIGSHTWSHKNLTKLTVPQMQEEMKKSADAISAITGVPVKVMRPPEGGHNETVRNNLGYPLIMWSVDSRDWKHRDANKDYNEVMNYVFDGSIVLMHDLYPATADAVEKFIPELIAKGYKFVTVSELMEIRGIEMKNGKTYSSARP